MRHQQRHVRCLAGVYGPVVERGRRYHVAQRIEGALHNRLRLEAADAQGTPEQHRGLIGAHYDGEIEDLGSERIWQFTVALPLPPVGEVDRGCIGDRQIFNIEIWVRSSG